MEKNKENIDNKENIEEPDKILQHRNNKIKQLGAINISNNEYVYPKIANKDEQYKCMDCGNKIVFCDGKKNIKHFRHFFEDSKCDYFNNDEKINENAILLLSIFLKKRIPIKIERKCPKCSKYEENTIETFNDNCELKRNYIYDYLDHRRTSDLVYLENNKIKYIFEFSTKYKELNERPEPYFLINSGDLLEFVNVNYDYNKLNIRCIRKILCEECIENEIIFKQKYKEAQTKLYNLLLKNQIDPFKSYSEIFEIDNDSTGLLKYFENDRDSQDIIFERPFDLVIWDEDLKPMFCIYLVENYEHYSKLKRWVRKYNIDVFFINIDNVLSINKENYVKVLKCVYADYNIKYNCKICGSKYKKCSNCKYSKCCFDCFNTYEKRICLICNSKIIKKIYFYVKYEEKDYFKENFNGKYDPNYKMWYVYETNKDLDEIKEEYKICQNPKNRNK